VAFLRLDRSNRSRTLPAFANRASSTFDSLSPHRICVSSTVSFLSILFFYLSTGFIFIYPLRLLLPFREYSKAEIPLLQFQSINCSVFARRCFEDVREGHFLPNFQQPPPPCHGIDHQIVSAIFTSAVPVGSFALWWEHGGQMVVKPRAFRKLRYRIGSRVFGIEEEDREGHQCTSGVVDMVKARFMESVLDLICFHHKDVSFLQLFVENIVNGMLCLLVNQL